ncbi:MAG: exopolyphosphatase [Gammaproteobacteria bacterium]|nr:exopolyphosphatase [Gammaproteobacteria bacterium]
MARETPDTYTAVDLGSNSFHMVVARQAGGRLQVVDRMKEMVRLAGGLDAQSHLRGEVIERAIACLQRFGQRLADVPADNVCAVGTNTLRKARNRDEFLVRAQAALGHRIDIISGAEEARLIYLGVSHSIDGNGGRRLVMDIGGGSTEVILGRQFDPELLESLYIGCVGMSQEFFADGRIDAPRLRAARLAARQEFEHIEEPYRRIGWDSAIGASGTIIAVRDIVVRHGWCDEGITPAAIEALERALIAAGRVDALALDGLDPERAPVFPGGVAILAAAFESLGIDRMRASSGALREGLLYDLLGRLHDADVRERTVADLERRYDVDAEQADRVAATANALFEQVAPAWQLDPDDDGRLLRWAARLHEIGLCISHGQYHRHGDYLLRNLDLAGFTRGEQVTLATLVRAHRRKLPALDSLGLPNDAQRRVRALIVLLRTAVVLHRSRARTALPPVIVEARESALKLRFPDGWLDAHPLSRADLAEEADYLKAIGFKLKPR